MTLFMVKLTLLLSLGAALASLLRERSAAARHFVWALTLAGALALAAFAALTPALPVALPDFGSEAPTAISATPRGGQAILPVPLPARTDKIVRPPLTSEPRRDPVAIIYLLGVSALLIRFIAGRAAVARIARNGLPANALIEERFGVTRAVRVVLSDAVTAPFTSGSLHPVILLPSDAMEWPEDRRKAAVLHEMAHIARHDYLVHSIAALACALYWFHPVAWLALRALRRESEQATDDLVISRGMRARDYAAQLLDVARASRERGAQGLLALGMACPSHFETRLRALLDETRLRGTITRKRALCAIGGLALLVVPLAAARPEVRVNAQPPKRTLAAKPSFQRTLDANPGGTLVLDLKTGASVDISGSSAHRAEIRGVLAGKDADRTVVDATVEGDEVRVTTKIEPDGGSSSTSHSFVINVPNEFNVNVNSAGGDLNIRDLSGTFSGSTGGGSITLVNVQGVANLTTGGGEINVSDSTLEGKVTTGGGKVNVVRVDGAFKATSGSGERSYERDGVIHINQGGGAVIIEEAPHGAVITTGGGQINIGAARGLVEASTGGGRILVGPVAGSVRALTGGGSVDITLADAGGEAQTIDVVTGSGAVRIALPSNFDGRFEIETAYTETHERPVTIKSDWPLQYDPVTGWDGREGTPRRYVRARGKAGNGRGLVRIQAVNGNVTIRRAD